MTGYYTDGYALRSLRGSPTVSVVVILTLAVALGMNAAIVSVFNAVQVTGPSATGES